MNYMAWVTKLGVPRYLYRAILPKVASRNNQREFYQFCGIARGSAAELETQLLAVQMIHSSIKVDDALDLVDEIQRMLTKLIKNLRN